MSSVSPLKLRIGGNYLMQADYYVGAFEVLEEYQNFYVVRSENYTTTIFRHCEEDTLKLIERE